MAAPNTSRSNFRSLSRKISGPIFKKGMGKVYRDLEKEGKLRVESVEQKAKYEAEKKEREAAAESRKSVWARIKEGFSWCVKQFD